MLEVIIILAFVALAFWLGTLTRAVSRMSVYGTAGNVWYDKSAVSLEQCTVCFGLFLVGRHYLSVRCPHCGIGHVVANEN